MNRELSWVNEEHPEDAAAYQILNRRLSEGTPTPGVRLGQPLSSGNPAGHGPSDALETDVLGFEVRNGKARSRVHVRLAGLLGPAQSCICVLARIMVLC
jgi:hypothetical protein